MSDPFEEMRGVALGERLRTGRRFGPWESPAEALFRYATTEGALALGFVEPGGVLAIDTSSPTLELVDAGDLLDALVFSGSPALVTGIERTPRLKAAAQPGET
jgi:cytosine/adenosine deaminase-related metal-dependent hydrolase